MKKEGLMFILVVFLLIVLGGVSFYFDKQIVTDITTIRNDFLDRFFLGLHFLSSGIIIFLFLTAFVAWPRDKRKWTMPLWFTFAVSAIIAFFLKIIFKRMRPIDSVLIPIFDLLRKANFTSWNFSFPSFTTMFVFSALPIISKNYPKSKYALMVLAGLIAFSRVYLGLHFLSDVLVGAIIGYSVGEIIVRLEDKNNFWEKAYNKIFNIY